MSATQRPPTTSGAEIITLWFDQRASTCYVCCFFFVLLKNSPYPPRKAPTTKKTRRKMIPGTLIIFFPQETVWLFPQDKMLLSKIKFWIVPVTQKSPFLLGCTVSTGKESVFVNNKQKELQWIFKSSCLFDERASTCCVCFLLCSWRTFLTRHQNTNKKEKKAIDNRYCDFLAKLQKLLVEITGPQMKISVSLSFVFQS